MKKLFILLFLSLNVFYLSAQQAYVDFNKYHSDKEIETIITKMSTNANARLHKLTKTPGGHLYGVLEIGKEINAKKKTLPAIFVFANPEGNRPLASEAALFLAQNLLQNPKNYKDYTWYILADGNPDAAVGFSTKPLKERTVNDTPVNDDKDDAVNEDGCEDLNKDGIITQMRVKSPDGQYIIDPLNKNLMRKANPIKGEIGVYKLYSEGIDNDNDGKYNEDPEGGVNIGKTFPHLFEYYNPESGLFPGSEDETFELIKFVMNHPEIAMTLTFGSSNFVLQKPKKGRKAKADFNSIKIPEGYAKFLHADKDKTYTMEEVKEMVAKIVPPGMKVTDSMIAGMLGLGAAVNPQKDDLSFYAEINKDYKEYLKKKHAESKSLKPEKAKDASFELWSYYQLGIPTFSMDFWRLPLSKEKKKESEGISLEKVEKMSSDEFIELGNDKISAFLKENNAPEKFTTEKLIEMLKSGKLSLKMMVKILKSYNSSPEKEGELSKEDKAFISFNENILKGKGFVEWKKFNHPQLGEVEIGGVVPFAKTTPPANMIDSILSLKVPYVFELMNKGARLKIKDVTVKDLGKNVYQVNVFIENIGFLPFTTAMGKRNEHPVPATLDISGKNIIFLKGYKHTAINHLNGHSVKKISFMLQSSQKQNIEIKLKSLQAFGDSKKISL